MYSHDWLALAYTLYLLWYGFGVAAVALHYTVPVNILCCTVLLHIGLYTV